MFFVCCTVNWYHTCAYIVVVHKHCYTICPHFITVHVSYVENALYFSINIRWIARIACLWFRFRTVVSLIIANLATSKEHRAHHATRQHTSKAHFMSIIIGVITARNHWVPFVCTCAHMQYTIFCSFNIIWYDCCCRCCYCPCCCCCLFNIVSVCRLIRGKVLMWTEARCMQSTR